MFKPIPIALAAAALAAMVPTAAQAQLSGSVGLVSLYKSNGLDQDSRASKNDNGWNPSLQGSLEYGFSGGFYVGAWAGTGKFSDGTDDASLELDLYAGYRGQLTQDLGYDISVVRYIYPGLSSLNGNEIAGALTYGPFTVKLTNLFVDNQTDNRRLSLTYTQPLSDKLKLTAVVGKRNKANKNGAADFGLGLAYDLRDGWTLNGTISGAQERRAGSEGETRLVLGISKGF